MPHSATAAGHVLQRMVAEVAVADPLQSRRSEEAAQRDIRETRLRRAGDLNGWRSDVKPDTGSIADAHLPTAAMPRGFTWGDETVPKRGAATSPSPHRLESSLPVPIRQRARHRMSAGSSGRKVGQPVSELGQAASRVDHIGRCCTRFEAVLTGTGMAADHRRLSSVTN